MDYNPPLDMIDSLIGFFEELTEVALILFLVATLVEGLLYRHYLRRSLISAMAGSLVANLASALLGVVLGVALLSVLMVVSSFELYVASVIVVSYAASVVVEGFVIILLYRQAGRSTWGPVSIANLASYIITAIVLYLYWTIPLLVMS